MRPLRVLTWHVHGNYLLYLSQANVEFSSLSHPGGPATAVAERRFRFPTAFATFPSSRSASSRLRLRPLPVADRTTWRISTRFSRRSSASLPRIYLEHDPPQEQPDRHAASRGRPRYPAGARDPVQRPHVGQRPHADARDRARRLRPPDDVRYTGELDRGIVVVNHLKRRGRRLGADVFERSARRGPARPRRHGRRVAGRGRGSPSPRACRASRSRTASSSIPFATPVWGWP